VKVYLTIHRCYELKMLVDVRLAQILVDDTNIDLVQILADVIILS
jgi:hypothetical protein